MIKLIILKYINVKQIENKSTVKNKLVQLDPRQNCSPQPGTSKASKQQQP